MFQLKYFYLFVLFVALYEVYRFVATKFKIYDKPINRSSHKEITITGGGIVFVFSIFIWFYLKDFEPIYICTSFLFLSAISYLDDLITINKKYRFAFHIFAALALAFSHSYPETPFIFFILIIIIISWLNAFNFMDGINGMTCTYSILTLVTFLHLNIEHSFIDRELLIYSVLPIVAFCLYNFRSKALMFCGDIGSISIGYMLFYVLYNLILSQKELAYILIFSVYGIETFVTIIERIIKKENITDSHRSHLYQILTNELKFGHIKVSLIYGFIQLVINIGLIMYLDRYQKLGIVGLFFILSVLTVLYIITKHLVKNKYFISKKTQIKNSY